MEFHAHSPRPQELERGRSLSSFTFYDFPTLVPTCLSSNFILPKDSVPTPLAIQVSREERRGKEQLWDAKNVSGTQSACLSFAKCLSLFRPAKRLSLFRPAKCLSLFRPTFSHFGHSNPQAQWNEQGYLRCKKCTFLFRLRHAKVHKSAEESPQGSAATDPHQISATPPPICT